MASDNHDEMDTFFAPPERLNGKELGELRSSFLSFSLAEAMLESIPDVSIVLSHTRQIIAVNKALMLTLGIEDPDSLIGLRPGELIECVHSHEMPAGCGTSQSCAECDAVQAILDSIATLEISARKCRIQTNGEENGGILDLYVEVTPVMFGGNYYFVMSLSMSDDRTNRCEGTV